MEHKGTHMYDDIIHLPHHTSPTRPRMSMHDRAAQFAPFAALTGHDAAVAEAGRQTEKRIGHSTICHVFRKNSDSVCAERKRERKRRPAEQRENRHTAMTGFPSSMH